MLWTNNHGDVVGVPVTGMYNFTIFDTTNALTDNMDVPSIVMNGVRPFTINEVCCEVDSVAGAPTVQLQRDKNNAAGSAASNILGSNLTCSTNVRPVLWPTSNGCATWVVAGENAIGLDQKIDFVMVTAGGTAKQVHISIYYTTDQQAN